MNSNLEKLYQLINALKLSTQETAAIKANIQSCLNEQVERAVNALTTVHNENELTESDVVWIDLDDATNAVKKAMLPQSELKL